MKEMTGRQRAQDSSSVRLKRGDTQADQSDGKGNTRPYVDLVLCFRCPTIIVEGGVGIAQILQVEYLISVLVEGLTAGDMGLGQ